VHCCFMPWPGFCTIASCQCGSVQDFNAKLSDFGLAKDGPDGNQAHVSTQVVGTYGYTAPELHANRWVWGTNGLIIVVIIIITRIKVLIIIINNNNNNNNNHNKNNVRMSDTQVKQSKK